MIVKLPIRIIKLWPCCLSLLLLLLCKQIRGDNGSPSPGTISNSEPSAKQQTDSTAGNGSPNNPSNPNYQEYNTGIQPYSYGYNTGIKPYSYTYTYPQNGGKPQITYHNAQPGYPPQPAGYPQPYPQPYPPPPNGMVPAQHYYPVSWTVHQPFDQPNSSSSSQSMSVPSSPPPSPPVIRNQPVVVSQPFPQQPTLMLRPVYPSLTNNDPSMRMQTPSPVRPTTAGYNNYPAGQPVPYTYQPAAGPAVGPPPINMMQMNGPPAMPGIPDIGGAPMPPGLPNIGATTGFNPAEFDLPVSSDSGSNNNNNANSNGFGDFGVDGLGGGGAGGNSGNNGAGGSNDLNSELANLANPAVLNNVNGAGSNRGGNNAAAAQIPTSLNDFQIDGLGGGNDNNNNNNNAGNSFPQDILGSLGEAGSNNNGNNGGNNDFADLGLSSLAGGGPSPRNSQDFNFGGSNNNLNFDLNLPSASQPKLSIKRTGNQVKSLSKQRLQQLITADARLMEQAKKKLFQNGQNH